MTPETERYLERLRCFAGGVRDKFQRETLVAICRRFKAFKCGVAPSKNIAKEDIILWLISKGLMNYVPNKDTGRVDKLPDDRPVRNAVEQLIRLGAPIVATSKSKGYYIAEVIGEVDLAQQEDDSRNKSYVYKRKGRERAKMFIQGQLEIEEVS